MKYTKWVILILLFLFVISIASFKNNFSKQGLTQQSPSPPSNKRLVISSYFAWYSAPYFSGVNRHWDAALTDHPKPGLYGISDGKYDSADPKVVSEQIKLASSIGIDGFMVSWWGGGDPKLKGDHIDDYIDQNFARMLDVASQTNPNFKLAIMFESDMEKLHSKDVGEQLFWLLKKYANHPNYLHYNNDPVVFIYNPGGALKGDLGNWKVIFGQIRKAGVRGVFLGDTFGRTDVFDGLWTFGPLKQIVEGEKSLLNHYNYGYTQAKATGGIWMATVMAGYNDKVFRKPGMEIGRTSCNNSRCFEWTWDKAVRSYPDWIHIGTWNEYHEATEIEESVEYGDTYLKATKPLVNETSSK